MQPDYVVHTPGTRLLRGATLGRQSTTTPVTTELSVSTGAWHETGPGGFL